MSDYITQDLESSSPLADLCIVNLIKKHVDKNPKSLAIIAPNRTPLTYISLYNQIEDIVSKLNSFGVGHNDRVAMALPNGPEMAVAFLSVAAAATCAPLNPAYRAKEFEFYLSSLKAKALIVQSGIDSPARAVAQDQGIPILELSPVLESEAGIFNLTGNMSSPNPAISGFAKPDDVALVVHTSGTTSRPKIVPRSHTNLCTSAKNIRVALNLVEGDRCLNVLPLFHIYGLIVAVLSSLSAGGSVVCTSGFDASSFFSGLLAFQPTWYAAVPTMHQEILTHTPANRDKISQHPLRFICSAAAALPQQVIRKLEATFQAPVIEHYGMTEASLIASNPLPPGERKPGSVGLAAGTQIVIMDEMGNLLPPTEVGEVVIQGANITQGYENNSEANAKAFTNGWFRTGDLGYLDENGYLFLKGRLKEIINRGGEKISPIEVDEVLMELPGIVQAVTFGVPHPTLGEDVAAAVVLREGTQLEEQTIRRFLFERLADFKVPSQVVIVDAIPKGATGKLQRIGLAEKLAGYLKREYVGPRNERERQIADIFAQVLGREKISVFDNFFALGGDSLRGTQVASRISAIFNVELVNVMLFQKPTVAELAEEIAQLTKQAPQKSIEKILQKDKLPLSFAQARLWFLDQLEPNSAVYNIPAAYRLTGVLNITVLEESLREITRRHSVLRTSFPSQDGQPFQAISSQTTLTLPVIDLSALPAQEREAQAQRLAAQEAQQPFNLATGPLLRVKLLCLSSLDHVLLLTIHHIVSDGWSMGLFWQELSTLYEAFSTGNLSPLPELPIQYADFAVWQRNWLQGEVLESQLSYWKQQLGGQLPVLELPTDRKRLPNQTYRGTFQSWNLPKHLTEKLKTLSQQSGATLFMTLLAAFKTLLYRYTQQEDIIVGSPIAGRNRVETEGLIGFFMNTLALRTRFQGNPTFRDILSQVRRVALGAYAHQDLPFEKLVQELQPARSLSHTPLFQVWFNMLNLGENQLQLSGLAVEQLPISSSTKFDLTLYVREKNQEIQLDWVYNADMFEAQTIHRMTGHFQTLLEVIVVNPDQPIATLPLLTSRERHQLLVEWNDTTREYPLNKCIHQLFEEQVERTPEHIAAIFENRKLSYREVNQKANQLAHLLKDKGVEKGKYIPVLMERSLELLLSHLAIMKTGAAFVPIDPKWPVTRIIEIFRQLSTEIFLVNSSQTHWKELSTWSCVVVNELELTDSKSNLNVSVNGTDPIYVIFTSGSTGQPKGAINQHRGITNRFLNMNDRYGYRENDVILFTSNHIFDSSVWQLFWPLINGNCTVITPPNLGFDLHKILDLVEKFKVTITDFVPSVFNLIVELLEKNRKLRHQVQSLRQLIIGGEAMSPKAIYQFKSYFPKVEITNAYGPTETSIGVIFYEVPSVFTDRIPIGRPLFNVQVLILDKNLNLVPIGVPGELYLGGVCVGLGYLNNEATTSSVFIPNPFSEINSDRLYKTGDLVRYLPDGNIEFLGRIDHQVKIRGIRIELGEIEATLAQHPDLREAVVIVREDTPTDKRLVAYVVPEKSQPTIAQLRSFLKTKLPDYMVPSAFVVLEAIPLTPNGKIDRRALRAPDTSNLFQKTGAICASQQRFAIAPRNTTELQLSQIWSEVLNIPCVGVRDNFFDLGGHSLLAVRLMACIEQQLGTHLPLATLFTEPTIEGQASLLSAATDVQLSSPLVPIRQTGSLPPFFCVHPVGGNVLCYAALAGQLGVAQPFYGLQAFGLNGQEKPLTRVEDMASRYLEALQTIQPQGPYQLGGWSFGGIVAFEIAQQLHSLGHEVALLALIDSFNPTVLNQPKPDEAMLVTSFARNLSRLFDKELPVSVDKLRQLGLDEQLDYLLQEARILQILPSEIGLQQMRQLFEVFQANSQAIHSYVPQPYSGQITLFCAEEKSVQLAEKQIQGWSSLAMGGIDIHKIPGDHFSIIRGQALAKELRPYLGF